MVSTIDVLANDAQLQVIRYVLPEDQKRIQALVANTPTVALVRCRHYNSSDGYIGWWRQRDTGAGNRSRQSAGSWIHSPTGSHGYGSADWLTMFFVEQRRYQEALEILVEIEPKLPDPSPARGRMAWVRRLSGEKNQAVTDLASILRDAPWYRWGWNLVLTWLEEDKNWQLCEEILDAVPPLMLTEVAFRRKRLLLLKETKTDPTKIDLESNELIRDFPEDVSLHLSRYDSLEDEKRLDDASEVLQRIAPIAGNNVYFLARLVTVECREKKFSEALDHTLTVCFAKGGENLWPINQLPAESIILSKSLSGRISSATSKS
jgi:hypothetical protein